MKINVVGTSGSGKTTFGKQLAEILNVPFVEMDALYWGPDWTGPTDQDLFSRLRKALDEEGWVLDGNYSRTQDIKWERVEVVIWLDFSFSRTMYQSASRAFSRLFRQTGNPWENSSAGIQFCSTHFNRTAEKKPGTWLYPQQRSSRISAFIASDHPPRQNYFLERLN